jgi:ATP-dependent helicase HrpB
MQSLPIDDLLPPIVEALAREHRLVLQAPPGTGKSTRVPPALLAAISSGLQILVAEPRRIAARLLANRVASELGQPVGKLVGYRVRFEEVCGRDTRLLYVTSGVLLRRMLSDPGLRDVGCVVIDEFHERHLDTDLLLALALRAQLTARPDLLIVVMSATLQGDRIRKVMGDCPYFHSEDQLHPISIEYAPQSDDRPLEKQVLSALRSQLRASPTGNFLVFLPGALEIRRSSEALSQWATENDLDLLPLHGDMPLHKQADVLQLGNRRKVVLATNVAESSVTIPGIVGVVDSGLSRVAACSPWSGLPTLEIQKISKASATQRAGRAGRLVPGKVTRLYTRADFESRSEFETPEMLRLDLCETILLTRGTGVEDFGSLQLVDYPSPAQLQAAENLLSRLNAVLPNRGLSELGKRMLRLPLHPRLARLVLESQRRGIASLGCLAAALLSERDLRTDSRAKLSSNFRLADVHSGDSDVEELIEAFEYAESQDFRADICARERIDSRAARSVAAAQRQLLSNIRDLTGPKEPTESSDSALAKSLLLAFPDRVAWRREAGQRDLVLANGKTAQLSEQSVVQKARYILALVADELAHRGKKGATIVRTACSIDPNWLLELCEDQVTAEEQLLWVEPPGRVEATSLMRYGAVILDETRTVARASEATSKILVNVADDRGLLSGEALSILTERMRILVDCGLLPEHDSLTQSAVRSQLERICSDRVDLAGINSDTIATLLVQALNAESVKILRDLAPESIRLLGNRQVRVNYESGRGPWIASRLQDFFGMSDTPRICAGRVALTLHLLAPNQRAVQVTKDLSGFWDRHYPSIRRELMRRYPRHQWPEDGRLAVASSDRKQR